MVRLRHGAPIPLVFAWFQIVRAYFEFLVIPCDNLTSEFFHVSKVVYGKDGDFKVGGNHNSSWPIVVYT